MRKERNFKIINITLVFILFFFFILPLQSDPAEDQQILRGMVSVVRSMDTFMKGTFDLPGLFSESSEVNGDLILCKTPMLNSWRIDGYLRYYAAMNNKEYQEMAHQIIDKIFKLYENTIDKNGNHWFPTQTFIAKDGKFYEYSKGPGFTRFTDSPYSYDQSGGKYLIEGAKFPDAPGIGFYEAAEMADYLDADHKDKLIKVIKCLADYWNDNDFMIYKKRGAFLPRTEDFFPSNPELQAKEPKWGCIGSDYFFSVLALDRLKQDTSKYDNKLMIFLNTYVKERADHNRDRRIDYLDSRVIRLARYFESKGKYEKLTDWVFNKLPGCYAGKTKKAVFMLNGSLTDNSTIPLLDLYVRLGLKKNFRFLWEDIWKNSFTEKGITVEGRAVVINNSAYPILLDFGFFGWEKGFITDEEFVEAVRRYYSFKGDSRNYRDLDDWVLETEEWDRINPGWKAVCYDGFPILVEPEAYYYGKPQAFTLHKMVYSSDMTEARKKENQIRNCSVNFTAPYEIHAELFRYGFACAFNLLNTSKNTEVRYDKTAREFKIEYEEPMVPKGMPCIGYADVTDIYYKDKKDVLKDGMEIKEVLLNGRKLPFYISHLQDYKELFSGKANAKLAFYVEAEGKKSKNTVRVVLGKRNFPYYVDEPGINGLTDKNRKDLPLVEKQNMQSVVDEFILPETLKWFEGKSFDCEIIVSAVEKCLIAYRADKKKVESKLLRLINEYEKMIPEKPDTAGVFLNSLTRIYFVYEGEKEKIRELIDKYGAELKEKGEETQLISLAGLMRYGILFNDNEAHKTALSGIQKWLAVNINEEGCQKDKETIGTVSILLDLLRLMELNGMEKPREISVPVEKMLEFLMYCSGPDGMVADIVDKNPRNIREFLYYGGELFKRADFRYVSFGGLTMDNSYEPKETSIAFEKSGIYILRNNWNIRDRGRNGLIGDKEMQEDRGACIIYGKGRVIIYGHTGILGYFQFKENADTPVIFEKGKDCARLKIKDAEFSFVYPKYCIIKLNEKYPFNCETAMELKGRIITRNKKNDIGRVEQRYTRGAGEIELLPLKSSAVSFVEAAPVFEKGEYLINFFSDFVRKRRRFVKTWEGNIPLSEFKKDKDKGRSAAEQGIITEKYYPETEVSVNDNAIVINNLDEKAEIYLSEVFSNIKVEITKKSFYNRFNQSKVKQNIQEELKK
ncbi:MAG: hypothetical protein V1752_08175 [Candidatus Firestonebacteria bacterium]